MIFASAQTQSTRWDIEKNLFNHYQMIELAAQKNANLIVFPELSISGYEHEGVDKLAFKPNDPRLDTLRKLALSRKIIVIAGAPIQMDSKLYIGSFVFKSDGSTFIYTKQFLHPGEEVYFSSTFDNNPLIEINGEHISLAICADIDNPKHPECASKVGSTFYMPSIFFSPGGLPEAYENLSNYAQKYSMNVLMSNFCGEVWGRPSGGGSAFWNNKGELVGNMNNTDAGLLLVEKINSSWKAQTFYL